METSHVNSLAKLPYAGEMAQWDHLAEAFGLPEAMLMELAGRSIFSFLEHKWGPVAGRAVWLFMGSGNNGGDAAVVARCIQDAGGRAVVFQLKALDRLKGAAAHQAHLAQKDGAQFVFLGAAESFHWRDLLGMQAELPALLVDGLLGTGFAGPVREPLASLIESINALSAHSGTPVLAVDLPSGLHADTGVPQPVAIVAQATVTLAAPKPGLVLPMARKYVGELVCGSIGLPQAVYAACPATWRLLDGHGLRAPHWPEGSYKNVYGHVLVIGGAAGHGGAGQLAALGALRMGAGLVTLCCPQASASRVAYPEIMTMPLREGDEWTPTAWEGLAKAVAAASALVIGPGLGVSPASMEFLRKVLGLMDRPRAVIDADALTMLAEAPEPLARFTRPGDVLTPHPGESGRLLKCSSREIQADRPGALADICRQTPATVVLKGAGTLIGQGHDVRLLCPYDVPLLAIGGAGDVLAGCVGACMARRGGGEESSVDAAAQGVLTHVLAAMWLARSCLNRGILASQVADALPMVPQFLAGLTRTPGRVPWPA